MSTVNVVVTVNVIQAIQSRNLGANVCMVDTNGYLGSGNEATDELITKCINGDTIVWTVVPLDPNEAVIITGFQGTAIGAMINPAQYPQFNGTVWTGRVNQVGTHVQYTMSLLLGGSTNLSFDPFITATNPTATR